MVLKLPEGPKPGSNPWTWAQLLLHYRSPKGKQWRSKEVTPHPQMVTDLIIDFSVELNNGARAVPTALAPLTLR